MRTPWRPYTYNLALFVNEGLSGNAGVLSSDGPAYYFRTTPTNGHGEFFFPSLDFAQSIHAAPD
jgi:hypothetical protein